MHSPLSSPFLRWTTPPPPRYRVGVVSHVIVLSGALLGLALNLANLPWMGTEIPVTWRRVASVTRLRQNWRMFAPFPSTADGWYDMEGITINGARVDLWRGEGEPNDTKPDDVARTYRNTAWRKYLVNIWYDAYTGHHPYFGRYLCRNWNERHGGAQRVTLIYVNYVLEVTPPPGQAMPAPEKVEIWRQRCPDDPPAQ